MTTSKSSNLFFPRPFLKWAGGKSQLITQYKPYFPETFKTYYEPFLGGGAIFFHLLPEKAILTDINPELINCYLCVKNQVEEVIELLETHQYNHALSPKDYYYKMRRLWGEGTPVERAARLIYLNKTCYNGLYRENCQGKFNVPIGNYKSPKICNPELLRSVSVALKKAKIAVSSFENVLYSAKTSDDFVYFDPPYHPLSSTSNFTAYSRYNFNESKQIKLRDTFAELANRGVKVMLSNSDCLFIRELYKDFNIYEISATRAINSNGKKRGKISEILVTSYERAI
ncbi:MAG: DNA adenine methylase [Oscillatoriaceae bacterium SKW80]|nr:DNA adenine methylase [Oscillatoriaceae bacterium SKYG93]MCX8122155.1 DNA adenine methylase [Oscillatoriaceae bacterium SKW80]MDW8454442.1 DNA adenine methylase [Oscillatoriaceae cyanobacterium SKYGB_i_bin93]HIK29306.1 DNA adenine methylase [Oscillatoriaceae cyanobacterium M7585_C2015_266]